MVNFSYPPGILNGQPGAQPQLNMGQPVLSQNVQAKAPALTGNARMSSRMPTIPDNRIGLNEGLIRAGGNIVGASQDGGLAALQAGTQTYGDIMDYNRQADMERMQIEQARILEEQRRQDLLRKLNAKSGKKDKDDEETAAKIAQADYQIQTMESILEGLAEGGLTGLFDGTALKWADRLGITDWWTGTDEGSQRAYLRQLLQEFKVDQTLTKTAHTKGAISNQEMALFMSPFPDVALDNEGAWIPQIQKRLEIAKKIRAAVSGDTGDYQIEEM